MDKLDHRELTLIKRAAEDAIHACNRHYKPFIDVIAHPLNIIALVEMAQSRQAEVDQLQSQINEIAEVGLGQEIEINNKDEHAHNLYYENANLQLLVEEKDKRIEAALVIVTKMAKATNSTAMWAYDLDKALRGEHES
ncbi:hypothetical protein [Acinetobacter sp.]|uniref:hypothetical protein n=1 Tax=Acinetobacter sp. TaxID=472 RepID=UPI0025885382|nr:hypothetical protein [Acinetobacter sp.]